MVTIGNSSGFWGDDPTALKRQLEGGHLDYVVSDYLAEVSMSILKKQHQKKPDVGYVEDFIEHLGLAANAFKKTKTRIITNAGGLQPHNCAKAVQELLKSKGINDVTVGVVMGDDLVNQLDRLQKEGNYLKNAEDNKNFNTIQNKVKSANVYYGVPPIVEVLKSDARIIITGRATDSALTIAPLVHEYQWKLNDWDKMASAMMAGHAIECGAQICGGNFTDWHLVKNWKSMGYPIVEVSRYGDFYITKHPNTGGMITVDTVKEQLLYEVGDPSSYISPDVIADLTEIEISKVKEDTIAVSKVKGRPSTPFLKMSMTYDDGYRASGDVLVSGGNLKAKAKIFEEILWDGLNEDYHRKGVEKIGVDATKFTEGEGKEGEMLLRFYVHDHKKEKVEKFTKHISALVLKGPQGIAASGGRPKVKNVVAYWPTLIKKKSISLNTFILSGNGKKTNAKEIWLEQHWDENLETTTQKKARQKPAAVPDCNEEKCKEVSFRDICLARSGDKGDMVNLAVIARSKELYDYLDSALTTNVIKGITQKLCKGRITKYTVPNLHAFNFTLQKALDGGGTKSLRVDAQGKTVAAVFLDYKIEVPERLLSFEK